MNKQQLFKAAAKVTGLAFLILLILNLAPAQLAQAAVGGWTPLTGGSGTGTSDVVNALGLDNSNNLYVGGDFVTAGGIIVNDIARWNGTDWSGFTGPSATGLASGGYVSALLIDNTGRLFITGDFATVGGLPAAYRGSGAKWNGTAWEWLDPTLDYFVLSAAGLAMIQDNSNNNYFGGVFGLAGNAEITVLGITRYVDASTTFFSLQDATTSTVGVNTPIDIRALALDGSNHLYAAGAFTVAGGEANTARIARWDGSNWFPLGAGIDNGRVNALAFDNLGNLYAGGTFTSVNGGTPAAGIAMWDGSTWTPLGSGVSGGSVNALAFTPDNVLYVGGSFTSAGGVAGTSRLARWSNGWHALPEGTPSGTVNALQYDANNKLLYVGGSFATAGSLSVVVNNVAIYQAGDLVVTTASDVIDANGGVCAGLPIANLPGPDGFTSLREAICAANAAPGPDTISFAASLNGVPVTLAIAGADEQLNALGDLDILDDLTIQGNGARLTIIDGGLIDRIFHIPVAGLTVTLNDVTLQNGLAVGTDDPFTPGADGGAILINAASNLNINNSRLTNNEAPDDGGALFMNTGAVATINNSLLNNNRAIASVGSPFSSGGAIASPNSTLAINNSTISNNQAQYGGAIENGGPVTLTNVTVTGNSFIAGDTAGLRIFSTMTIRNSIISGNGTSDCGFNPITSQGNNVLGSGGSANGCTPTLGSDIIPVGAASTVLNITLADNGGPTETHALVIGSIALDSGDNTTCAAAPINNVDQRGVARPQNTICDIGAYELVTPVTPGAAGGLGPGGVGHTDGSTSLELWLRSDRGIFSDVGCTTPGTDGNTVACWEDQSGNNFDFTNAVLTTVPVYELTELGVNSQPSLQFSNDRLSYTNFPALTGVDNYAIYGVSLHGADAQSLIGGVQTGNTGHGVQIASWNGNDVRFLHRMPFSGSGGNDLIMTNNAYTANTPHIVTAIRNRSSNIQSARVDGGTLQSIAPTVAVFSSNLDIAVGNRSGGANTGHVLHGYIGEVVIFTEAPADVRRLLVENYLSSKFNITIPPASDFYDGDTVGNGNFDLDVAGIGRFGSVNHTQAHAAGMIVVNGTFLQDNGDWLLFGHNSPNNNHSPADLPTTGDWATAPNPLRWARHFYIDVTDGAGTTGGTVDIIFDFSEGNMSPNSCCAPDGDISNYRLLKRTGTTGQFTDIATATAIVGDQVYFQGVDVTLLGSNFTLGSLDSVQSPTAVTLQATNTNTQRQIILPLVILLLVGVTVIMWSIRYARIPSNV